MKLQLVGLLILFWSSPVLSEEIRVLDQAAFPHPELMVGNWLDKNLQQAFDNWRKNYEALKTPEQIVAYQQQLRTRFLESLGGFPERTPLNHKVTGVIPGDGFRVEKILFESQPRHYVTGLCFIPNSTKFQAPYPGVVVVCGHSANGKAYAGYQSATALLALNGMVGFIIDPICQGERYDQLKDDGSILIPSTTDGHSLLGCSSILLGHNTARNEIWDAMRAIDYLQQRDDVDPEKIGCMGNSGGGTQSSYLVALDDRIRAAAPSCYLTSFERLLQERGPQDAEQNIFGQLNWGMDHADYVMLRAPVPVLMCTATHDAFPIDGSWTSFRDAKRLFTRLGYPERVDLVEVDGPHGWHQPLREAAVRWMSRWLAGRDVDVREPKIDILTGQDVNVTEKGQVLLLPGAKSGYDLNLEEFQKLEPVRQKHWEDPAAALEQVRKITGIPPLSQMQPVPARSLGETMDETIRVEHWVLEPEAGIVLPALLYRPAQPSQGPLLYVNEAGKQAAYADGNQQHSALRFAQAGHTVLAVDLRGQGETKSDKAIWYHKRFGSDAKHAVLAYLLEKNLVGLRAQDLQAAAKWFLDQEKLPLDDHRLTLVAVGSPGVSALHLAALEQKLFAQTTLVQTLPGWAAIFSSRTPDGQYAHCIHGAARLYDFHHLAGVLGDRLQILNPAQVP